jgi:hypothetical protein
VSSVRAGDLPLEHGASPMQRRGAADLRKLRVGQFVMTPKETRKVGTTKSPAECHGTLVAV